jgi:predicted dinucleotide-binding enzyme
VGRHPTAAPCTRRAGGTTGCHHSQKEMSTMKIGILGSGNVGQSLAKGLKGLGHDVVIGSSAGNKLAAFSAETGVVEKKFADAVTGADVVIVALKGQGAEEIVRGLAGSLAGKVVLDATNPIAGEAKGGIVPYFTGPNDSLLQRLQKAAPGAKFVKCFNSVAAHLMVKPHFKSGTPAMFICGDDADAKATTTKLLAELGWAAEDVGGSEAGNAVEALCQLWCAPGFLRNDWSHAYAVLRS